LGIYLPRRVLQAASAAILILAAAALINVLAGQVSAADDRDQAASLRPNETMTGIYVLGGIVAAEHKTWGYPSTSIILPKRVNEYNWYRVEIRQRGQAFSKN
jgi:hypothetical protein